MGKIGLFGKMPSVGDFVCRGFSPETADRLDHLLQLALASASGDGCNLEQLFETAPTFMLSVRPGALGAAGLSVLVMPSCDRVGRLFPLCAGIELNDLTATGSRLEWPTTELMTTLCLAMAGICHADGGPDDLLAALPQVSAWQKLSGVDCPFQTVQDITVPCLLASSIHLWFEGPASAMTRTSQVVCRHQPWVAQALGCVLSPQGTAESFFATRALQTASALGALVDSDWGAHGWDTYPVKVAKIER